MTRQPRALTGFKLVSGRCGQGTSAPADALLAADADAGAFTALGGQDTGWRAWVLGRRRRVCRARVWTGVVRAVERGQGELP